jgi:ribulose-phosphate 3-epimerase
LEPDIFGSTPVLSVGITSADLMNLAGATRALADSGVRMLHFDVMDGHFAPQLTVGPSFVKGIKTTLLKDVHLMIDEPLDSVDEYVAAGANVVTVHVESCRHVHRVLQRLGELAKAKPSEAGLLRGVGLNPSTPLSAVDPLLDDVDLVVLLAVNPGFPRQEFIPSTVNRFEDLRRRVRGFDRRILLGIDGGVNRRTIAQIAALGPDLVVSGSAVFEGGVGAIAENVAYLDAALHARPPSMSPPTVR